MSGAYTQRLPDWLGHRAGALPDRPALIAGGRRWTFADLDRDVSGCARRLAAFGAGEGARVAVLLGNGALFAQLIHAVARLGAVLVPLNVRLTPAELAWQLADVQATLLIYDDAYAPAAGQAAARAGVPSVDAERLESGEQAETALRNYVDLDDVHSILYTSGTTGSPKGAMLTYGNHWWSAAGSAFNLGTHADDCWLCMLPLYHVGGLSILMRGAIYGVPAVVHESFDAERANRAIDEDGVTIVSVVSVMLRRMLEQRSGRPYPPHLRCVLLGGGPAPQPLLEACATGGVPVVQTYGLTETASQVATLAPAEALRRLGSAGRPLLPNALRIDRDGAQAAPGEPGEILVHGPSVTAGYVNNPDATAAAIRDGWLHTGDLGYLDQDGYLYVLDRRDDLILSGGENVYPAEIEATLLAHPAIEDAGVAGVADERWGQAPIAVVVLRPGATANANSLRTFCAQRLAHYKLPRQFWRAERLPRNATGKLQRNLLRAALSGDPATALPGEPL